MKTKTIEDYYCTSRYRLLDIVHITENEDGNRMCNNKHELTWYSLSTIQEYWDEEPITLYSDLCIKCIKKLPDNVREEVIYNYVLAKVKK